MILSCPNCQTRYDVPDIAVGPKGRQIRCAACQTSWFQEPEDAEAGSLVTPAPVPVEPDPAAPVAADAEVTGTSHERPVPEIAEPSDADASAPSPAAPPPRRRSSGRPKPARMWMLAAVAAALILLGGIGALQYFGTPTWVGRAGAQIGLSVGDVDVPLLLQVARKPERRTLPSGNELFALTGRVVNPTSESQRVPDISVALRDSRGKAVYGWTITPPRRTIAPMATMEFDSAELDVPKNARALNLSFSGETPNQR